jgi:virulence-associated protein VapD
MKTKKENFKVVNFDLDTHAIKSAIVNGDVDFKGYTSAYGKIRRFLEKGGFEHDQGSGYVTKAAMSARDVSNIFTELGIKNQWLPSCMSKCRLSSFEKGAIMQTDLMPDIQAGADIAKQKDSGLASSPSGYSPIHDPHDKEKADALRDTLTTSSIKPTVSSSAPTQTSDAKNKAETTIKAKIPSSKNKGGGNPGK